MNSPENGKDKLTQFEIYRRERDSIKQIWREELEAIQSSLQSSDKIINLLSPERRLAELRQYLKDEYPEIHHRFIDELNDRGE